MDSDHQLTPTSCIPLQDAGLWRLFLTKRWEIRTSQSREQCCNLSPRFLVTNNVPTRRQRGQREQGQPLPEEQEWRGWPWQERPHPHPHGDAAAVCLKTSEPVFNLLTPGARGRHGSLLTELALCLTDHSLGRPAGAGLPLPSGPWPTCLPESSRHGPFAWTLVSRRLVCREGLAWRDHDWAHSQDRGAQPQSSVPAAHPILPGGGVPANLAPIGASHLTAPCGHLTGNCMRSQLSCCGRVRRFISKQVFTPSGVRPSALGMGGVGRGLPQRGAQLLGTSCRVVRSCPHHPLPSRTPGPADTRVWVGRNQEGSPS